MPREKAVISLEARGLLDLLKEYAGTRRYCWPALTTLSERTGKCKRQVQRYLRELEAAGVIVRRREGLNRTNRYFILDRWPDTCTEVTPMSTQEVTPMSTQEVTPMSTQEVTPMSTQEVTPMSTPIHAEMDPEKVSSSKDRARAAAAVHYSDQKTAEAIDALHCLGMPPGMAKRFARRCLNLCLTLIPHFRERFTDPRLKPIESRVGYMVKALRYPEEVGCEPDGQGGWTRPPPEGQAARNAARDERRQAEAAQRAAQQAAQVEAKAKAEAFYARWHGRWESLTEPEREAIRRQLRRSEPLFVAKDDSSYLFHHACLTELQKLEPP